MAGLTMEQRNEIIDSLSRKEPVWRIADRMGIRPRTIRKWRQRYNEGGRAGLQTKMGRPSGNALSSFTPEIREAVLYFRRKNPGWGAKTLLAELKYNECFRNQKLPSSRAIGRFLSESNLIDGKEPSIPLPKSEPVKAERVHHIWEMDARGYERIPDVGMVSLIDLNDRFSHARLLSYPCCLGKKRVERHAKTEDYQAALRTAFMEWGLPEIIQVDHESVFYDNRSKTPFPTRFHLWLLALGIPLTFIPYNQPTKQGMTERSHQLWYRQVIQGHTFDDWNTLYNALEKRRTFLNHHLPCRSTSDQPPLVHHLNALHSGRDYHLGLEEHLLDLQRVYNYLTQGRWFRLVSKSGTVSLGAQIYYIGLKYYRLQTEISFCSDEQKLLFHDDAGCLIHSTSIKGISKAQFMGNLDDLSRLPRFQLPLPFSYEQQQMARLIESNT